MASRRAVVHRKLLDSQAPEAGHGPILGILATSYELDSTFVEVELLPALFGLGAWDDRSWASRVALEKSLAEIEATTILVDHRRYRGRPRSPRIEVLPVSLIIFRTSAVTSSMVSGSSWSNGSSMSRSSNGKSLFRIKPDNCRIASGIWSGFSLKKG